VLSTLHDGNHGYPRVGVPILGTGRETRRLARPPVRGTRSRYTITSSLEHDEPWQQFVIRMSPGTILPG